tara:strand:- start:270 stop:983 length:714 start_codon:yes stop_codon:yes gene_type:complete
MGKNSKLSELSIIIPIFNEEGNIEKLFDKIKKFLIIKKYEVIFIDDNSKDNSLKILQNLNKRNKKLKYIIRKSKNKDLSKSCIMGFEKSKYKNILVMDGDFQHDPIYIPKLIKNFDESCSDIVVGCRDLFKKNSQGLSLFRAICSILLIHLMNICLGKKTADPMSGFFLFKKKLFLQQKKKLYKKGYKILADIIYNSKKNIKISDIKIRFKKRYSGKSKLNFSVLIYLIIFIKSKIV